MPLIRARYFIQIIGGSVSHVSGTRALSQSQVMRNQQQLQDYHGHLSQVTQLVQKSGCNVVWILLCLIL